MLEKGPIKFKNICDKVQHMSAYALSIYPQKFPASKITEKAACRSDNMALYFECPISALLQTVFLPILPTGLMIVLNDH